jgi:hypothetical protein
MLNTSLPLPCPRPTPTRATPTTSLDSAGAGAASIPWPTPAAAAMPNLGSGWQRCSPVLFLHELSLHPSRRAEPSLGAAQTPEAAVTRRAWGCTCVALWSFCAVAGLAVVQACLCAVDGPLGLLGCWESRSEAGNKGPVGR